MGAQRFLARAEIMAIGLLGDQRGRTGKGASPPNFWHNHSVTTTANRQDDPLASLTDEQRAWAVRSEQLWAKAHELARSKPGTDPGDVYHALRCLDLPVSERLRQGLARGKLRPKSR